MSEELIQRAIACIASTQRIPAEKITLDSTFEELGIDSLDGINIVFALENEFNLSIPDQDAQSVRSVREMCESLARVLGRGQPGSAAQA